MILVNCKIYSRRFVPLPKAKKKTIYLQEKCERNQQNIKQDFCLNHAVFNFIMKMICVAIYNRNKIRESIIQHFVVFSRQQHIL